MSDFAPDLSDWMGQLPDILRNMPIIYLAIPGSHDSMSYGVQRKASVAPDAPSIVKKLNKIMPCVIRRWAITQSYNVIHQLMAGIRYLDFRVSKRNDSFYFVHGLYCEQINGALNQLNSFLHDHPKEFVIVDFQHFYEFDDIDFEQLAKLLLQIFGSSILATTDCQQLTEITLNSANVANKQILIIYRTSIYQPTQFWPSDCWPSPWPNKTNVLKLQKYLNSALNNRSAQSGYITQCVLTPSVNFIIPRFMSSLRNACAKKIRDDLFEWISIQKPGPFVNGEKPTSNIFIADFIDLKEMEFCKIVINLNMKLELNS